MGLLLVMNVSLAYALGRFDPTALIRNRLTGQRLSIKALIFHDAIRWLAFAVVTKLLEENARAMCPTNKFVLVRHAQVLQSIDHFVHLLFVVLDVHRNGTKVTAVDNFIKFIRR